MKKTVIVTGGAGFIGSNFVFHMLDKYPDYRIVCLDKLTYAGNLSTLASVMDNKNFRFVKADICDREAVRGRGTEHNSQFRRRKSCRQKHRRSRDILANKYNRYGGTYGRVPQVRNRTLSPSVDRRGVRRFAA